MKIKLATMVVVIIMALLSAAFAKPKASYTFDPYSLRHSSYRAEDCTRTGDTLACRKAYLEFATMVYVPAGESKPAAPRHVDLTAAKATPDGVVVTFNPKQCKLVPPQAYTVDQNGPKVVRWKQPDEWECKHVTFRWIQ